MPTLSEVLEQQASRYPERPYFHVDGMPVTLGEVNEQATRFAVNLWQRGIGPGDKVLTLLGNCLEFVYLFLGLSRIGAVIVPVNPSLNLDEVIYIAGNSDARVMVMTPSWMKHLDQIREKMPNLSHLFVVGEGAPPSGIEPVSVLSSPVESVPGHAGSESDDACIIYTSGTTGLPKGVLLSHANYLWNSRIANYVVHLTESDRFLGILPFFHVNAQVGNIIMPLLYGASTVMIARFNPFAILPLIEEHKITLMNAVPTIYDIMSRMSDAEQYDVQSIRAFITGAAPLSESTYRAVQEKFNRNLRGGYGLTEATCVSTMAYPEDAEYWNTVGPPLPYMRFRIMGEDGREVPVGEIGEIQIAGPTVMKGYYKDPEATAEVLRDGWLRTGDLGRFDREGRLYIEGRLKEMIIRAGMNIYPQQIEQVLSEMEGIHETCVIGVPDPQTGEKVVAMVKKNPGYSLSESDVLAFCRERLAPYKCPKIVCFIDELPKTATGKIIRRSVEALYREQAEAERGESE